LGIGDWGLGIGDWGPIPNPQSPIPNPQKIVQFNIQILYYYKKIKIINFTKINKIYSKSKNV